MAYLPSKIEQIIENGYEFRLGEYISRGFDIMNRNAGLFIGYFLTYFAISIVLAVIPFIGGLASMVIAPALSIGTIIVAQKTDVGESVDFNDFFKGFNKLGNLFLVSLLAGLIAIAAALPGIILLIYAGISSFNELRGLGEIGEPDELLNGVFAIFLNPMLWVGFLAALIPAIYLTISYLYAPMLVYFYNMEPWPAMEASRKLVKNHWGITFLFLIVLGLIGIAGFIVLVGILYTVPATQCATYAAFADITRLNEADDENQDDLIDHFVPGTRD